MQIVKTAKARKANGKILLEGERLMADAMKAGLHTDAIFFSSPELLGRLPLGMHAEAQLYQVHQSAIQLWSELTTSPGIAGMTLSQVLQLNPSLNVISPCRILRHNQSAGSGVCPGEREDPAHVDL